MVLWYLICHKGSKRCKSSHISKNGNIELLKLLNFQWRRFKVLYLWECSGFFISNSIIVSFKRLQVCNHSPIYPSVKTNMALIISGPISLNLLLEEGRQAPILNNRLVVVFRVWDPHHLHFPIFIGESQMDLFMTILCGNLHIGYLNQFLEGHLRVEVCVKEFENRIDILVGDIMLGLHLCVEIIKLIESGVSILISVIRLLPELL